MSIQNPNGVGTGLADLSVLCSILSMTGVNISPKIIHFSSQAAFTPPAGKTTPSLRRILANSQYAFLPKPRCPSRCRSRTVE